MVSRGRHHRLHGGKSHLVRTSDEQRTTAADNLTCDGRNLLRRLPQAKDDFGESLADAAMVINLGKPKILKGLVAKRGRDQGQRVRRIRTALLDLLQECL
jgi:hypothetical protein